MKNLYTNHFCDLLTIVSSGDQNSATDDQQGPFRIFNKTKFSLSADDYPTHQKAIDALIEMGCSELELPSDGTFAYNSKAQAMCIDGTNEEDQMEGGAMNAPFYIFNISMQENMAGPFSTHEEAVKSLAGLAAQ